MKMGLNFNESMPIMLYSSSQAQLNGNFRKLQFVNARIKVLSYHAVE